MNVSASHLIAGIGWTLVHFVWQGALLGLATATVLTAMRNTRPEYRYNAACAAMLLCLAWPAFELYLRLSGGVAAGAELRFSGGLAAAATRGAAGGMADYLAGQLAWIVAFWALCATTLTLRMALGLWWVGRMGNGRSADPQWQARLSALARTFDVTREVRLRVVDNLASPITAGWWRPVVLVPAALLSGMPPELLEALLAHEMAHIKRFDYLVNLGQNVVETLLFYHPAVWWISRQVRVEREQIADDIAAKKLGEPRRLALALSELERFQFSTHHLVQGANGGDLMSRIKRLVRPDTQALNWKAAIPVLGLAAACLALHGCATTPKEEVAAIASTKAVLDFNSCAKPQYPAQSVANEETGTVTLGFLVSADGKVIDSKIMRSSGFRELDKSAIVGISRCQFKPATVDGKPVQEWAQVQYVWRH